MIKSAEEFYQLRTSAKKEDYRRAATEQVSHEVCLSVIDKYPEMKKWIVHNKTVPLEILHLLADDPDVDVRFTLAMKNKCDAALFKKLSNDQDFSVRMAVVRNSRTPRDILEVLATDKEREIASEARTVLMKRA